MIYINNNKEFYNRDYVFLGEKMNCFMLCRLLCFFWTCSADRALSARSCKIFLYLIVEKRIAIVKPRSKIRLLGWVMVRSAVPLYPNRGTAETKQASTCAPPKSREPQCHTGLMDRCLMIKAFWISLQITALPLFLIHHFCMSFEKSHCFFYLHLH